MNLGRASAYYFLGNMFNVGYPFSMRAYSAGGQALVAESSVSTRVNSDPDPNGRSMAGPRPWPVWSRGPWQQVAPATAVQPGLQVGIFVTREDILRDASGTPIRDATGQVQGNGTIYVNRKEKWSGIGPVLSVSKGGGTVQQVFPKQDGLTPATWQLGATEGANNLGFAQHSIWVAIEDWSGNVADAEPVYGSNQQWVMFAQSLNWKDVWAFSTTNTYKITRPSGDPTVPAQRTTDNQFVFDDAKKGKLKLDFKATWHPDKEVRRTMHANTRWVVTPIGDSHTGGATTKLTWNRSWAGSPTVGQGAPDPATDGRGVRAIATFTGLPASNDAFGAKLVQVHWHMPDGSDFPQWQGTTAPYQVFYRPEARNNPGAPHDPNWFYYWAQAVVGSLKTTTHTTNCSPQPTLTYDPTAIPYTGMEEYGSSGWGGPPYVVGIGPSTYQSGVAGCHQLKLMSGRLCGIDFFTYVAVHESQHYVWKCDWWENNEAAWEATNNHSGPTDDWDQDGLPNQFEENTYSQYGLHWQNAATLPPICDGVGDDQECLDRLMNRNLDYSVHRIVDWSFEGFNHNACYWPNG